ncbi:MAG: quinone oxidoreductase family protein [Hyphomicrobiaceae bacterium]
MANGIVLRQHGEPDTLVAEDIDVGAPGPGELRIRQTAVGVNFHDIYVRSGLYKTLALPGIPGVEAAGIVEEVGDVVSGVSVGDRVGYVTGSYGAYASERRLPAELAIKLPDGVDELTAAASLLKGLTVDMLIRRVHHLKSGDTILVHAAAGGVGRLLCQWASHIGVHVIGTVGSEKKAAVARAAGCKHVILYRQEKFVERVREITLGHGVDIVYDSVGLDTFTGSLESLAMLGHLVNFGQSSGNPPPVEVAQLARGSFSLSRPIIFHYLADRNRYQDMAANLFAALNDGILDIKPGPTFALSDAAAAHQHLESRQATGPIVMIP